MLKPTVYKTVIENIVIAIAAYLLGFYFTSMFHIGTSEIGGLWSVISGLVVIEGRRPDTFKSAKLRVVGSFIGAVVSGVYLYFFSFTVIGFAACIGVGALVCYLLRIPSHIKLTGITISVIMIVSIITQNLAPFMNAALRFAESVIGTLVAIAVAISASYIYSSSRSE